MQYLAKLAHNPAKFLRDKCNRSMLILSGFIFLVLCAVTSLVRSTAHPGQAAINAHRSTSISTFANPTTTSTKWWIKITTTTPQPLLTASTALNGPKTDNCSNVSSSPLRKETFAYIARMPTLPNRIRSSASLLSEYLGQIEPGAGLRVIDGPVCADGYSWWLVESLDRRLRGWTVEGRNSEHWLIPCPDVNVQCSFLATPTPTRVSAPDDNPANPAENTCESDKLAVGMLAHVHQDSLLVIRSEPSVGAVIGHAGPMTIVNVIKGPSCVGGTIWWKVNALDVGLIGWTTENYLELCPKDSQCNNLDPS